MVERPRLSTPAVARSAAGGNYFAKPKNVAFIRTGSKLLDLVLGGGWAEGRVANIIGDKSTGKTLLCIEAAANFIRKYKDGKVYYREVEAAFDVDYARALGMPVESVDFGDAEGEEPIDTIEDLFEDMQRVIDATDSDVPILYIVDSLDALSDREEMKRNIDTPTYGGNKPKKIGELFRRMVRQMRKVNMTMIIVSQVRSKIGVSFGDKTTRSGGRALDFYASQFIKLAHLGIVSQTRQGVKRAVGVSIKAKSTKNKIGLPFRECEFDILFGYGVDDLDACLRWLVEVGGLEELDYKISKAKPKKGEDQNGVYKTVGDLIDDIWGWDDADYRDELTRVRRVVETRWWQIEESHLPTRKKY